MGSTKPKPIKYYGLYMSPPIAHLAPMPCVMGVTSFSKNPRTEMVMAHGTELDVRASTHRQVEGMNFYLDEGIMSRSITRAMKTYEDHTAKIEQAEKQLNEMKRARRIAVERELNRQAIIPSELESL